MNNMNDNTKGTSVEINLVEGSIAPRYEASSTELVLKKAVITKKGMASGLPLVDIVMQDSKGNEYFFMASGRIMNMIASAVRGASEGRIDL